MEAGELAAATGDWLVVREVVMEDVEEREGVMVGVTGGRDVLGETVRVRGGAVLLGVPPVAEAVAENGVGATLVTEGVTDWVLNVGDPDAVLETLFFLDKDLVRVTEFVLVRDLVLVTDTVADLDAKGAQG